LTLLTTIAVAISALAFQAAPVHAAPAQPNGLLPSGTGQSAIPTLAWDRVDGATGYDVQVSANGSFSPTLWTGSTVNLQIVPTVQIPADSTVWWRVRSKDSSGVSEWSTTWFTRTAVPGPRLISPANTDVDPLDQPDEPVLLTWLPVGGVSQYTVQISQDVNFSDPDLITTRTTNNTSLVMPPQVAGTYYWRVTGTLGSGIFTSASDVWTYRVGALAQAQLADADTDDEFTPVDDIVLDWLPVDGAKSYDLQISTDESFPTATLVHSANNIFGTRYSPTATLGDDQYWWRVRARDAAGNVQKWEDRQRWTFNRDWQERPQPQYPADDDTVGDPLYFEWEPSTLASKYRLDIGRDPAFSPSSFNSCTTVNTTLTPSDPNGSACWPTADGATYYWRVIGFDEFSSARPPTDATEATPVFSFQYRPERVQLASPADGESVQVPTLQWSPLAGAAKYRVTVTPAGGGTPVVNRALTATTSYTPRSLLDAGTYRWDVVPVTDDGREGAPLLLPGQRTFVLTDQDTATASAPDAISPLALTTKRFPSLSWDPVAGADYYKVFVQKGSTGPVSTLAPRFEYPAGDDDGTDYITAGDYNWWVQAYDSDGLMLGSAGTPGRFTVANPDVVTGHKVGLTGRTMASGTCAAGLPAECQNLRQTPVLSWDPQPDAGYYLLYLSRDANLNNLLPGFGPVKVLGTQWTPSVALEDSNAQTAYYWSVRPCKAANVCDVLRTARNAFNKLSNPVVTHEAKDSTPGVPGLQDDITFTWDDYLDTNAIAAQGTSALSTKATTEARQYEVEVATDTTFFGSALIDSRMVDQRTYTAFDRTYPEGNIYWRVRAYDGSNKPLPWSDVRTFLKESPPPGGLAPAGPDGVSGRTPLTWSALPYAGSYRVEVYKNGDTTAQPANRVVNVSVPQVAYAPGTPFAPGDYAWRVRRVDSDGRDGAWSSPITTFTVRGADPQLASPAGGATVPPSDGIFTWHAVPDAASYRWERRIPGSSSTAASVPTKALAYAPTAVMPDGDWEWRVVALDSGNGTIGASEWRPFDTYGAPRATTATQIQGSGAVGTQLTGFDPAWDLNDVTNSYQWLRGTAAIPDATSSSYTLTRDDLGKQISLRVTGSLPGYRNGTSQSNSVTGVNGAAPTPAIPPTVAGSGSVGGVVSAGAAVWNEPDVATSYQWLRNGAPISRATSLSYTVTSADIGASLAIRTTGTKTGYASAVLISNAVTGVAGHASSATGAPSITGVPAVGSRLSATGGTWTGSPKLSYQWLRNGAPIAGATSSSYTLTPADAAQHVNVRVSASATGYNTGVADSAAVLVAKMKSTTTASGPSTGKAKKKYKLAVAVSVPGVTGPTGQIQVKDGRKVVKKVTLAASKAGKITIKIKGLKKGKHKLKAFYLGNGVTLGSKSGKVKVVLSK
jgi:hypothetical protein